MNRNQRVVLLFGLLLISVAMLGCANNQERAETAAYQQDLVRARASIAEAEQAGAARFGSAELALAVRSGLTTLEEELRRADRTEGLRP